MACTNSTTLGSLQPACFSGRAPTSAAAPLQLQLGACLRWRRCRSGARRLSLATQLAATFPRDGFQYLSPEAEERLERELEEARQRGLQEYADLKALLLKRTWRFGTLFALYLLLTTSGETAALELLGAGASYGYLLLLFRDVDALAPGDRIYMQEAEAVEPKFARGLAKWAASYRHALRPRLLVLVGLAAAVAAYNAAFPEDPITLVEQGCLLGGFLAYKVALIQKVYDDLKPKVLTAEELMQQPRPGLVPVDDVEFPWEAKRKQEEAAAAAAEAAGGQGGGEAGQKP